MAHYPHYNSPKEINLEDFIDPSTIVETGVGDLVIQENKIYPKYPIYIDYGFYNWGWTLNEDTSSPNKWMWMDENSEPILGSEGTASQDSGIEVYAPIRIWMMGKITEAVALQHGTRDNSRYLGSRLRDLTPYRKDDKIDLGIVTADRTPHSVEFVIKDNVIHTNYDFGNDPEAAMSIIMVYETLTKNVKLKIVLKTNTRSRSTYTPTVNGYILKISGQSESKELVD